MLYIGQEIEYYGDKATVVDVATIEGDPVEYRGYTRYVLRIHNKKERSKYSVKEGDSGEYIYADTSSVEHSEKLLDKQD